MSRNVVRFHEIRNQRDAECHGLRKRSEEMAFTARPKINSQFQIFRYSRSIFCLPHRPTFSDFFDLCLHWVSVVRAESKLSKQARIVLFASNRWPYCVLTFLIHGFDQVLLRIPKAMVNYVHIIVFNEVNSSARTKPRNLRFLVNDLMEQIQ